MASGNRIRQPKLKKKKDSHKTWGRGGYIRCFPERYCDSSAAVSAVAQDKSVRVNNKRRNQEQQEQKMTKVGGARKKGRRKKGKGDKMKV